MARELSLLDRLRRPDLEDRRLVDTDHGALARSVMRNMDRLLNSREGSAATRLDYGIPSIEDLRHGSAGTLRDLAKDIQKCIETFEPRLENVRVRPVAAGEQDVATLRFEVQAELVTGTRKSRVRFETRVEQSGHLEVKD